TLTTLAGCAAHAPPHPTSHERGSNGIESEEDYQQAISDYYERSTDPDAAALRRPILRYLATRIEGASGRGEDAVERLRELCFLVDPADPSPEAHDALLRGAVAAYRTQSKLGAIDGTVLSMAVLATLEPKGWLGRWNEHLGWMQEFDLDAEGTPPRI